MITWFSGALIIAHCKDCPVLPPPNRAGSAAFHVLELFRVPQFSTASELQTPCFSIPPAKKMPPLFVVYWVLEIIMVQAAKLLFIRTDTLKKLAVVKFVRDENIALGLSKRSVRCES